MGMSIEEAIATIKGEKWIGCQEKHTEAINLMENTMRKYQKIQDLIEYHMLRFLPKKNIGFQKDVLEVVDNENVD